MKTFRTKGFTAKDQFIATTATPIKAVKGNVITVAEVAVSENSDGVLVGYIKDEDGVIYATISSTIIDQLIPLSEMLEDTTVDVKVISKVSSSDMEYFMLELQ